MEALSSAMASSAGAPLRGGQQGLEDCHRRMDLINAARKLRGLPVRLAEIVCVGPCGIAGSVMWVACEPDILTIHRCIDQVRDYQNNPKAFARDVLRFEIALEGVKFLRSLEYAPRDAALTDASVPSAIAAATPPAVTAVSTPTPLAAATAGAPAAPVAPVSPAVATATTISGGSNARESIDAHARACTPVAAGRSTTPATSSDWVLCMSMSRSQVSVLECVDPTSDASSQDTC